MRIASCDEDDRQVTNAKTAASLSRKVDQGEANQLPKYVHIAIRQFL
jgi:hypothetical protein